MAGYHAGGKRVKYSYNGIAIKSNAELDDNKIKALYRYCREKYGLVESIDIRTQSSDRIKISCTKKPESIEHIRRITGYLVGTLDRFNDAKKAEEKDRVKHV